MWRLGRLPSRVVLARPLWGAQRLVRGLSAGDSAGAPDEPPEKRGFFGLKWLSKEAITVRDPSYNRWKAAPGAMLIQATIGSVYSWSVFNGPLSREMGVVAAASSDWALSSVIPIFSCCAITLGLCTALLGPWAERVGPRVVGLTATSLWAGGLAVASAGCFTHTLPLVYLGYSFLGGAGWGLGYSAPVAALMKFFPDRKGVASTLTIASFGGGAVLAAPLNEFLLKSNFRAPKFLGLPENLSLVTSETGQRLIEIDGQLREVVVAGAGDLARLPVDGLEVGAYLAGTGSTGSAATFLTLSLAYGISMSVGSMLVRVPSPEWLPPGYTPPSEGEGGTVGNVNHSTALKTPQFWLLWTTLFGNAIAGVTMISASKTMMTEVMSPAYPHIVNGAFASTFVVALSASNMFGRLLYGPTSDVIGRRRTVAIFGLGVPVAAAVPSITGMLGPGVGVSPLVAFYGSTALMLSFYGGIFAPPFPGSR